MEVRLIDGVVPNGWLLDRFDTLWNEVARPVERRAAPAADVIEDADGYRFYFEVPGLAPDSIDVRVEEGRLVVEAERKRPEWPKEATVHVAERVYGKLSRIFDLPEDASHEGVAASYRDGVLEVAVAKKAEAKPVKIKVNFEN